MNKDSPNFKYDFGVFLYLVSLYKVKMYQMLCDKHLNQCFDNKRTQEEWFKPGLKKKRYLGEIMPKYEWEIL